ncbi:hypothetical protein [Paracoccus sp. (in: a-proteobacteria)]
MKDTPLLAGAQGPGSVWEQEGAFLAQAGPDLSRPWRHTVFWH